MFSSHQSNTSNASCKLCTKLHGQKRTDTKLIGSNYIKLLKYKRTIFSSFGWCIVPPQSLKEWLHQILVNHPFKGSAAILWESMARAILWTIWNERNQRIFNNKYSSFLDAMESSIFHTLYWCKHITPLTAYNFSYFIINWKQLL